jgi:hypothetical protein
MIKRISGIAAAFINPKCNFDRSLFILGHMRCGSTALSHILCSHPQISGYGEAHIRYDGNAALGLLALNQIKRNAYRSDANMLFDKILHSRYDAGVGPAFFRARAIFMVRDPVAAVNSIRKLFGALGSHEYSTDTLACDYYEERISTLLNLWQQFSPERRIGLSYAQLTADPDAQIAGISRMLGLKPPLTNNYSAPKNILGHGAGDPMASHKYDRIVPSTQSAAEAGHVKPLEVTAARLASLQTLYSQAIQIVTQV